MWDWKLYNSCEWNNCYFTYQFKAEYARAPHFGVSLRWKTCGFLAMTKNLLLRFEGDWES